MLFEGCDVIEVATRQNRYIYAQLDGHSTRPDFLSEYGGIAKWDFTGQAKV